MCCMHEGFNSSTKVDRGMPARATVQEHVSSVSQLAQVGICKPGHEARHTSPASMMETVSPARPQTNRNVREPPAIIFLTREVPTTRSKRPASVAL